MPKATECLISAELAIQLREMVRKSGRRLGKVFRCKVCNSPVKPMVESSVGKAHFEHFDRNIDCPLSDKRTIRRAYSQYKATKNE
jgi:hypothetical protein